jgi:RHS repeat-associated protein
MDYSYDTKYNRLTSVTTSSPTQPQATQTYSYSSQADQPAHAPTAFPASSFGTPQHVATYDATGNVTTAGAAGGTKDSYTYDAFGKYASVTRADGTREDYVYGPDGTRVGLLTTTGSGAAATVTATLDIAGAQYKTGQTALLAVNAPDGELLGYRHQYGWTSTWTDLQGSVRYLTDGSWAKRDYYPHGALADTTTGVWSRGYLGAQHDKPGQIQLGHRKYPAQHRTFLNPDPVLVPFEPGNLNPYAYAQQNPISLTDPSGLNVDHDHITPGTSGSIGVDEALDCDTIGDCNNSDVDGDGVTTATAVYGEEAVDHYTYNPNRDFQRAATGLSGAAFKIAVFDYTACGDILSSSCALEIAMATPIGKVGRVVKYGDEVVGAFRQTDDAAKRENELVQRWMSRAELDATIDTRLVRGGRDGTHYVTDFANHNALRARQRLALPQTGEVRVQLEVPRGAFSPPKRVDPDYSMPGGGMERTATGSVPCRVVCVWD